MARKRRKLLRRLFLLSGIAGLVAWRKKQMDDQQLMDKQSPSAADPWGT